MQVINSPIQSRYGEETGETEDYIVLPKEKGLNGKLRRKGEMWVILGNDL